MPEKLTSAANGNLGGFYYEIPDQQTVCEKIGTFIYDSKNGKFFTRTPLSWAKIFLFYCIFYSVLACMFSGCIHMLLRSLDPVAPRWLLDESRIGSNPGLGFRPHSPKAELGHTLLVVNTKFNTQQVYIEYLDEFLKGYQAPIGPQYEVCDYARAPTNRSETSCSLDVTEWEPCTQRSGYGYNSASPCVFLKLNKIFAWEPDYYNETALPNEMPQDLKQHIQTVSENEPEKMRKIWISCDGENVPDQQNLGPVRYIPERGFPGYFYPFVNTKGYLSPLVALHFERPTAGVIVNVECKAWAQNIRYDKKESLGSVKFQIFVE